MKRYRVRPGSIAEHAVKVIGILVMLAMWAMLAGLIR